jgi:hypothetical protein
MRSPVNIVQYGTIHFDELWRYQFTWIYARLTPFLFSSVSSVPLW